MSDLEPISPRDAFELYQNDCKGELSPKTIQARNYRVGFFLRWCDGVENGGEPRVENMNNLTGRDIYKYRNWRKQDIKAVTLKTHISDLRQFLKFCIEIDAVEESMPDKVGVVNLDYEENVNDAFIGVEKVRSALSYLQKHEYASRNHVIILLAWETGARAGGLHSLDANDFNWQHSRVTFAHRPDEGTRLKNRESGERTVTLDEDVMEVVSDYIDVNRDNVEDDYGRKPLFTSTNGRLNKSHFLKHFYWLTAPCKVGQECPAGKNPEECEYAATKDAVPGCPHNNSSHEFRRGAVTRWLQNDVPEKAIGDRVDMSPDTMDKHYDKRSSDEKAEQRREFFT